MGSAVILNQKHEACLNQICTETLCKYDQELENLIIDRLLNKKPLSNTKLKEYLEQCLEKTEEKLQAILLKTFPNSWRKVSPFLSMHIERSRQKYKYYEYINSMRSLYVSHKAKVSVLLERHIKKKLPRNKVFESYLKQVKGSFAFSGLVDLDKIISSNTSNLKLMMEAFAQTKKSFKQLEKEIEASLTCDSPALMPKNFQEIRSSLQKKVKRQDFPLIPNFHLF